MNKKLRKVLSLLCVMSMLFASLPFNVVSETATDYSAPGQIPDIVTEVTGEDEFWEDVVSEHIDDYTVTVTIPKEAEFPIGTTVQITPLQNNAEYRSEAAGIFEQNDNQLGTFIRVFDITFYYDGMEIEPLVPVGVTITFDEAVQMEGENELKLIHVHEEEEAKEIAVEAQTSEVTVNEGEAGEETQTVTTVESLSFESDKFSTYIVAEEVVVYSFTESGNNYEVVVKYNAGANIPEDAVLSVEEITEDSELYEQYTAQVAAVINPKGTVRMPVLLDICLKTASGEKVQLGNKVQVIVRLTGNESLTKDLKIVHFPGEDPFEGQSAVRDAVENADPTSNDPVEVIDIASERLFARVNTEENSVSFNTNSFSVFAFAYTVDFFYNLNGKTVEYHIPGGSVYSLRTLLPILGIVEDDPSTASDEVAQFIKMISAVSFTDESLVKVVRVDEDTTAGAVIDALGVEIEYAGNLTEDDVTEMRAEQLSAPDWALVSLKPFFTEEELTITLKNGEAVKVKVTDEAPANPNTYIGKQVIIYDNGEQRALTADWGWDGYRNRFISIDVSGADADEKARWTVEYANDAYYLKAYNGQYLRFVYDSVSLESDRNAATPLTIYPGNNPDYRIFDKNYENSCLCYYTNNEYYGYFGAVNGNNNGSQQQWLYIREANIPGPPYNYTLKVNDSNFGYFTVRTGKTNTYTNYTEYTLQTDGVTDDGYGTFYNNVTATANSGYRVCYWLKDDGSFTESRTADQLNGTNVTSNHRPNKLDRDTTYIIFFAPEGTNIVRVKEPENGGTINYSSTPRVVNTSTGSDIKYYYTSDNATLTATPQSGNIFVGWFDENNQLISTETTFQTNSVQRNIVLSAKFIVPQKVSITVSVNDPNGGDVVVTENGQDSSYCGTQQTKSSGLLNRTITAKPKDGYEFCYWTHNGNVLATDSKVLSYDPTKGPTPYFEEGDVLQAVFKAVYPIDANGSAHSTIQVDPTKKQQFQNWLASLENGDSISANKTAKVSDYDNRIYQIDIDAATTRTAPQANIGIAFVLDASNSMQFPATLARTGKTMVLTQENLNKAFPNSEGPYYIISDPEGTSTVYRIYKEDGIWYTIDASYYDVPDMKASRQVALSWNCTFAETPDVRANAPLSYPIYRDAGAGKRAYYLNNSLANAVNTMRSIVSKVNRNDYDIKVAYDTFAAYTQKTVSQVDGGIDGLFKWVDFQSLKNNFTVNLGDTGGGTRQDLGLQDALLFNWDSIPENQRYVILITDGASVIGSDSTSSFDGKTLQQVRENIVTQANALKTNKKVKLITVGLSTRNVVGGSNILKDIASYSAGEGSDKLFFEAESGDDLENIIYEVLQTVVKNGTSCGYVVDEVDEAFYPVKADGTPIPRGTSYYNNAGNQISETEYNNKGVWESRYKWEENNGKWKITWEHQYIGWNPVDANLKKRPWQGTFYVKAKENFLGGNTISTNIGDCKVVEEGYTFDESVPEDMDKWTLFLSNEVSLPVPYVNVDELALTQNSTEWTVYLGTSVDPLEQLKDLYSRIDVLKVVSGDTDEMITSNTQMLGEKNETTSKRFSLESIAPLTDTDWNTLIAGGTVTKQYDHYGHTDVGDIQIQLTRNEVTAGEKGLSESPHDTEVVGDVEKYTFTVTYTPTAESDPATGWHTTPGGQRGTVTDGMNSTDSHVINVFAKGLRIEKKDEANTLITTGTAKFKLYRKPNSNETASTTLTVAGTEVGVVQVGNEMSTTAGILTISDLEYPPEGTYYLVETEAPEGYSRRVEPTVIQMTTSDSYWGWNQTNANAVNTLTDSIKPYNWEQTVSMTCNGETVTESANMYGITVINPGNATIYVKKEWNGGTPTESVTLTLRRYMKESTDGSTTTQTEPTTPDDGTSNPSTSTPGTTGDTQYTLRFQSSNDNQSSEYKYAANTVVTVTFDNNNQWYNPYDDFTLSGDIAGTIDVDSGIISFTVTMDGNKTVTILGTDNSNWSNIADAIKLSPIPATSSLLIPRKGRYTASAGGSDVSGSETSNAPDGYVLDPDFSETVTLSSTNSWIEGVQVELTDSNGEYYYYEIVETDVPSGFTVTYSDNNPVRADADAPIILTATNTRKTGSLKIQKNVLHDDAPKAVTGTFRFGVYTTSDASDTQVASGSIELNNASSDTTTISGLPYGTYYVFELDDQDQPITTDTGTIGDTEYTVEISGSPVTVNETTGGNTADVTANNKTYGYQLVVRKEWQNVAGAVITGTQNVQFKLIRHENGGGGNNNPAPAVPDTATVELRTAYSQNDIYTIDGTPWSFTTYSNGSPIYVGDVVKVALNVSWYGNIGYHNNGHPSNITDNGLSSGRIEITITVNSTTEPVYFDFNGYTSGTISVTKVSGYNSTPAETPEETSSDAVMKPASEGSGYEPDPTGEYTYTLAPGQVIRFNNLPYTDTNGNVTYTYEVVETTTGYTTSYRPADATYDPAPVEGVSPDGEIVIVNRPYEEPTLGHLTVRKVVIGMDPKGTYKIGVKDASGNYYQYDGTVAETQPFYLEMPKGESRTWSNLTPGTYTIEEVDAEVEGFVLTATGTGNVQVIAGQNPVIDVTNTYRYPRGITATKVWDSATPLATAVRFELKRQAGEYGTIDRVEIDNNPATVTAADGWTVNWTDLDRYADDHGTEYSYFVVETGVYYGQLTGSAIPDDAWTDAKITYLEGGDVTFTGATEATGTARIVNKEKTNVPVVKTWDDFSSDEYSWTVNFQLQKREELVSGTAANDAITDWQDVAGKTLQVSKSQATGTQFEDLDLFHVYENGSVYRIVYRAEEIAYEVRKTVDGTETVIASWDKATETFVTYNNKDYEAYYAQNAGEDMNITDLLSRYSIVVENRPKVNYDGKLVIHKEWLDIYGEHLNDLQYYPDVFVSLYRVPSNQWMNMDDMNRAELYDPDGDGRYTHHRLSYDDNKWTWVIDDLPEGDNYRYFVIEEPYDVQGQTRLFKNGSILTGRVIVTDPEYASSTDPKMGITLEAYKARDEYGAGEWRTGNYQEAVLANTGNTGEILIQNNAPSMYMQMDLKKKFLEYRIDDNGVYSLWTTTSEYDTMKDMIIEIQVMRRMIDESKGEFAYMNDGRWEPYGNTIFVGYDANGNAYINPNNNLFQVVNGDGTWHFRIPCNEQHEGLPRRGYYPDPETGKNILVRYQYILKEVQVYDGNMNKVGEDWAAWLPWLWDGRTDTPSQYEVNVPKTAQDQDRLFNTPGAKLYIEKTWSVPASNVGIQEIYVKVYRRLKNSSSGTSEDYVDFMCQMMASGLAPDYMEGNPSGTIDTTNKWLVLSPSNSWRAVLHKVQISTNNVNDGEYEYYIVEVGYKDRNGDTHTTEGDVESKFDPQYYKRVDNGESETMGTGLVLQWKHQNYLGVHNTLDEVSIPVEKEWTGGTPDADAEVEVEVVKVVDDTEVPLGRKLTLKADTDPAKNWKGIFTGLEKTDSQGNPITYRIKETKVVLNGVTYTGDNLATVFGPEDFTISSNNITDATIAIITNPIETKTVIVKKEWPDGQTVPDGTKVTFAITATISNGTGGTTAPRLASPIAPATVELDGKTEDDEIETVAWEYIWTELPKYDLDCKEITYTVAETGYTIGTAFTADEDDLPKPEVVVSGNMTTYTFTNALPTREIKVMKAWPDGQTVPEGTEVTFTITATVPDGEDGEKAPRLASDIDPASVVLDGDTEDDEVETVAWEYTWTELPKYDLDGVEITYTVAETGYKIGEEFEATSYPKAQVSVDEDGVTVYTFENTLPTTDITVKKTWSKGADWPENIEVGMTLLADEEVPATVPSYTVTEDEEEQTIEQSAEIWLTADDAVDGYTWRNLPVYTTEGKKIAYTVEETGMRYRLDEENVIDISNWQDAFTTDRTPDEGVVTIDNTPETTEIQITKIWTVNGVARTDQTSIAYLLYRSGVEDALDLSGYTLSADLGVAEANQIKYVSGNESGAWQIVTISGLPKYEIAIKTVNEQTVVSYDEVNYRVVEEISEDATTRVTYSLTPEATEGQETPAEGDESEESPTANSGLVTIYNRDTDLTLKVLKADTTDNTKYLTGAVFQLLKDSGEGTYVPYTKPTFAESPYDSTSEAKLTIEDATAGIEFQILTDGSYQLAETKAPDGYSLLQATISFTVTDGVIEPAITVDDVIVLAYTPADESNGPIVTIGNTPGVELPSTGGSGTLAYTLAGLALMLLAGVLLVSRKRRTQRNSRG